MLSVAIGVLSKETDVEQFVHAMEEYSSFSLTQSSLSLDGLSFSYSIHTKQSYVHNYVHAIYNCSSRFYSMLMYMT